MATVFVAYSIKFHHTMLVLNTFLAILEVLVSDNQSSSAPRDLPLRPPLVRLLVRPHHPVKKTPGYGPDF